MEFIKRFKFSITSLLIYTLVLLLNKELIELTITCILIMSLFCEIALTGDEQYEYNILAKFHLVSLILYYILLVVVLHYVPEFIRGALLIFSFLMTAMSVGLLSYAINHNLKSVKINAFIYSVIMLFILIITIFI